MHVLWRWLAVERVPAGIDASHNLALRLHNRRHNTKRGVSVVSDLLAEGRSTLHTLTCMAEAISVSSDGKLYTVASAQAPAKHPPRLAHTPRGKDTEISFDDALTLELLPARQSDMSFFSSSAVVFPVVSAPDSGDGGGDDGGGDDGGGVSAPLYFLRSV